MFSFLRKKKKDVRVWVLPQRCECQLHTAAAMELSATTPPLILFNLIHIAIKKVEKKDKNKWGS